MHPVSQLNICLAVTIYLKPSTPNFLHYLLFFEGHDDNGLRCRLGLHQPDVCRLCPYRVGPLPRPALWLPRLVHLDTLQVTTQSDPASSLGHQGTFLLLSQKLCTFAGLSCQSLWGPRTWARSIPCLLSASRCSLSPVSHSSASYTAPRYG